MNRIESALTKLFDHLRSVHRVSFQDGIQHVGQLVICEKSRGQVRHLAEIVAVLLVGAFKMVPPFRLQGNRSYSPHSV